MDRLGAMTAFAAVADRNSFAAAARHLRLSPPAVTRLIAGLEDHLGVALLRRTTRSVTLTDAGARYLERVRRILSEIEEAESAAEAEQATPSGRLVVSAPLSFGRLHISPLMADYLQRYPEVSGELMLSDRFVNLVEDGIDVALRIGQLADTSLIARRVGVTRRVVVASPAYLAKSGTPQTPADLAGHDIIRFAGFAGAVDWGFARDGVEERLTMPARYVTNSADSALWYAIQGGGLAVVLTYRAVEAIAAGELKVVLQEFERPALPIQFVYPSSRLLSSKVRALIDLAVETRRWEF
jgi:DNA-binding transcriptional LysR family regulator